MKTNTKTIIGGVAIVVLAACGYGLHQYGFIGHSAATQASASEATVQTGNTQVDDVLSKLAKHMQLPQGDSVSLYTIQDPALLTKQQAFFTGSSAGDLLVVFPKSQMAVIYSPSKDAIVRIGPVTNYSTSTATSTQAH